MKSERGDIATVGFVVVFLLLMAALGVIFYQNVINKPTTQPQQSSEEKRTTDTQKATERMAYKNNIFALDRPLDWKAEKTQPASSSQITVTSPDGSVAVRFSVSSVTQPAPCREDVRKVRFIRVEPQSVTMLTDVPVYLVEAVYDRKGEDGFQYVIGLVPDGGDTHASVGDSHCTVKNVGFAAATDSTRPTIRANIIFPGLPEGSKNNAESIQQVTSLLNSEIYQQAKQVILSARKE